jgi:hypothetical protein
MTNSERVQAIADYGFTERQARFLVLVMRHSGLCIKRQYGTFAGVARGGQKCKAFFDKLVRRGYVIASDCVHNRARLYHVHHKPLYHAIGEPESRYRRGVPARQAAERLMRLDAALMSPDVDWLTTRSEKLAYLTVRTVSHSAESPSASASEARLDLFPGTFPIGIDAVGGAVLVYVATKPWTEDFRTFLVGHVDLLAVLPTWTLRVVFPPSLQRFVPAYQRAAHEQLENRLDAQTINDLRWYFFHCRRGTNWTQPPYNSADSLKVRFHRCAKAFAGPRLTHLYRRWLTNGDTVLTPVPVIVSEAFASGRAGLDLRLLSHTYEQFSPLVSGRRSRRPRVTADATEGGEPLRNLNPALNPVP